jgi:hypothetical protein
MPSVSKKQHNFMEAIAHSKKFAKKVGVPQSVGKDFAEADKGCKFGTGGSATITRGGKGEINKQATRYGSTFGNEKNVPNINLNKYIGKKEGGMAKSDMKEDMKADIKQDKAVIKRAFKMHDSQEHKDQHTDLSKLKKGGMTMKKMATGGATKYDKTPKPSSMAKDVEAGSNKLLSFGESAVQKRGHTKGKNLGDSGPIKGIMGGAKRMAKGGTASSRADGCAERGKTKGTMMCMGGKAGKK